MATRKEVAEALNVTPQAVSNWWKRREYWFPVDAVETDKGRAVNWDLERIQAAYRAKLGETSGPGGNEKPTVIQQIELALRAEKLKQERLKTQRLDREERIRQGLILDREEWTLFARESIVICRDQIAALPKQLARLAAPNDRAKMLSEGSRIVNTKLSQLAVRLAQGPCDS